MINFLNSTNRSYEGKDLNKINEAILEVGVLDTNGTDLETVKTTGLDVNVKKGSAVVTVEEDGEDTNVIVVEPSDNVLTCTANATNYIIQRVFQSIIDGDTIDASGSNSDAIEVVTTLPATDPYTLLATVTVPLGATSLTDEMIEDSRSMAEFKESMVQKIIDDIYENNPIETLDFYTDGIQAEQVTGNSLLENRDAEVTGYEGLYPVGVSPNKTRNHYFQTFTVNDTFGSFEFKKSNNNDNAYPITIDVTTVDESGAVDQADTIIQTFSFSGEEWQDLKQNSLHEIFVDETLYTANTKYGLYFNITSWGTPADTENRLATSDTLAGNVGIVHFEQESLADTWSERTDNLIYAINKKNQIEVGKATSHEQLMQTFTDVSDITYFELQKEEDTGTPTEDFKFYIQEVDGSNEPIGDIIIESTISNENYDSFIVAEWFKVNFYVVLNKNKTYGLFCNPLGLSDANHRNLTYGALYDGYTDGKLRQYDGANWNDVNYDLKFRIYEYGAGKIVKIDDEYVNDSIIRKNTPLFNSGFLYYRGDSEIVQVLVSISPNNKYIAVQSSNSNNDDSYISIYEIDPTTKNLIYRCEKRFDVNNSYIHAFWKSDTSLGVVCVATDVDIKYLYVLDDFETDERFTVGVGDEFSFSSTDNNARLFYNKVLSKWFIYSDGTSNWKKVDPYTYADDGTSALSGVPNFNATTFPVGYRNKTEIVFYENSQPNWYTCNSDGSYTHVDALDLIPNKTQIYTSGTRNLGFCPILDTEDYVALTRTWLPTGAVESLSHKVHFYINEINI